MSAYCLKWPKKKEFLFHIKVGRISFLGVWNTRDPNSLPLRPVFAVRGRALQGFALPSK